MAGGISDLFTFENVADDDAKAHRAFVQNEAERTFGEFKPGTMADDIPSIDLRDQFAPLKDYTNYGRIGQLLHGNEAGIFGQSGATSDADELLPTSRAMPIMPKKVEPSYLRGVNKARDEARTNPNLRWPLNM